MEEFISSIKSLNAETQSSFILVTSGPTSKSLSDLRKSLYSHISGNPVVDDVLPVHPVIGKVLNNFALLLVFVVPLTTTLN